MAKMLINGESVAAISSEEYPVHNPANGQVVDTAPKGAGKRQFKLHLANRHVAGICLHLSSCMPVTICDHSNAKSPCGDSEPTEVGFAMMCRDF